MAKMLATILPCMAITFFLDPIIFYARTVTKKNEQILEISPKEILWPICLFSCINLIIVDLKKNIGRL